LRLIAGLALPTAFAKALAVAQALQRRSTQVAKIGELAIVYPPGVCTKTKIK
jgi:hypothetical protein